MTCPYNKGNPSFTTVYWEKEMNSSYMYPGQTLRIPNIDREAAGNYVCIAENTYSNGQNGSTNSTMYLDVQCQLNSSYAIDSKYCHFMNYFQNNLLFYFLFLNYYKVAA